MPRKIKTKEEILTESLKYKKKDEKILDAFRKEYGSQRRKCWYLKVKCLVHNEEYLINTRNYQKGSTGCKRCSKLKMKRKRNKKFTKEKILEEGLQYKKENEEILDAFKKEYGNQGRKRWYLKIKCLKHNHIFSIAWEDYKHKSGCCYCSKERAVIKNTKSKKEVEQDFLSYLKPNETLVKVYQKKDSEGCNRWWGTLFCKNCNKTFKVSKSNHNFLKNGCPKCSASKGETRVREYLINNNIVFEEQYRFEDCKYYKPLPFDFYVSSLNLTIEYQGRQHYKPVEVFGGEKAFKKQQKRDKIKKEYCQKNNIKLLEISYTEYDNIEEILSKELKI